MEGMIVRDGRSARVKNAHVEVGVTVEGGVRIHLEGDCAAIQVAEVAAQLAAKAAEIAQIAAGMP